MKKSQGMSISVIIVAVLALAVLLVLLINFTKGSSVFSTGVFDCESKGGTCQAEENICPAQKSSFKCPKDIPVCCLDTDKI